MSAIKNRGSKLEKSAAKLLRDLGIKYRFHPNGMVGNPDFYLPERKTVVFVDSCFWHGCPYHGSTPKSNARFWKCKITENKKRDRAINKAYKKTAYGVLRIWEHQLRNRDTNNLNRILTELSGKM